MFLELNSKGLYQSSGKEKLTKLLSCVVRRRQNVNLGTLTGYGRACMHGNEPFFKYAVMNSTRKLFLSLTNISVLTLGRTRGWGWRGWGRVHATPIRFF